MSSRELAIRTAGLGVLLEWMREIPPLPGFVHRFQPFASLVDLEPGEGIVIADESLNFPPPILRQAAGKRARCVLCAGDVSALSAEDFAALDDLWPKPLSRVSLGFYFRRLQGWVRDERDAGAAQDREYQQRLLEMARQDCLTGLATRWYLQEYLEENKNNPVTCVTFDLDHFKEVNDTWGHQAGDKALAATAEMMQREFPDGFAARLGGDEFMVVLPGKRPIREAEGRVNLFMKKLMDYYRGISFMRRLSISAGLAQTDGQEALVPAEAREAPSSPPATAREVSPAENSLGGIDRLIRQSDRALYQAKESGRACCRVYDPSMEN